MPNDFSRYIDLAFTVISKILTSSAHAEINKVNKLIVLPSGHVSIFFNVFKHVQIFIQR